MKVLVSVLLIAIGVFYTVTSFSNVTTEIMDIDFDLDTDVGVRYDSQPGISKERMQQRIRMGFTLDYRGTIQLIGLVSTGNDFDSDWQTIYDLNSDDTRLNSPKPFFRQLYAQMKFKGGRVQLGAIPPIKNKTSATGLDKSGWIDGVRVERYFGREGVIEIVAGSIGDVENPNVFSRDRDLDFFEIEISEKLFERVFGEVKFEHFKGRNFLQGTMKYDLPILGNKLVSFAAEYIQDINQNSANSYSVGAETDLLRLLNNALEGRLEVGAKFVYVDKSMGERGRLNDSFYIFGQHFEFNLAGKLTKSGNLKWFSNYYLGQEKRFNLGIQLKF